MRILPRLALVSFVLAGLLLLAGGAAFLFRETLAQAIVVRALASRGASAELQIRKLGWNETIVEDLSVEELHVNRLQISYALRELMHGQIKSANIEGMRLDVDLTGNGPPLGKLQSLLTGMGATNSPASAPSAQATRLPALTLTDAQIFVLLSNGTVGLSIHGALTPNDTGSAIAFDFETSSGSLLASGELRAVLVGTSVASLALDVNVTDDTKSFEFAAQAMSQSPNLDRPELQFDLSGEGGLVSLARYSALDDTKMPTSGTFRLNAQGDLVLPMGAQSALGAAQGEMTYNFDLSDVRIPDNAAVPAWILEPLNAKSSGTLKLNQAAIAGDLSAAIDYADHPASFEFSAPEIAATVNDDYSLGSFDLNEFTANMAAVPTPYGTLGAASLAGNITNIILAPAGTVRLHATSPAVTIASVAAHATIIDANLALQSTEQGYLLALAAPARFSIGTLNLPAMLPIEGLNGQIRAARLELSAQNTGYSFAQSAEVTLPALAFSIERSDGAPVLLEFESAPISIESSAAPQSLVRFTLATVISALGMPAFGMLTRNSNLDVGGIVGGEIAVRLHGGSLVHEAESPYFTILTPDLRMIQNGNHLSFAGDLMGANDRLEISIHGNHDLGAGIGDMHFVVDDLEFGPNGTNGAALSPLLASMENLRGHVNGEANFSWNSESFENGAHINIQQISFRRDSMTIDGLSTELTLSNLYPARSPTGQKLTIGKIETGIEDVTSLELQYRLDATEDGTPRVYTEVLGMNIAGGRITAAGGSFDPTTGASTIPLKAENIDLARLLSHIGLDELTGVGQLSGTIPFTMSIRGASIEGATLQASAPGTVNYRSARARDALATGGDSVKLMLDALEDFHYDTLGLTLSKPVAGETAITLRMTGNNPAVLDGNPFDINMSLTGDADPLLQALLAGQRLSDDLIRSMRNR
nr:MAG: hypothetical protein E4H34_03390 [Hyphomicrobiales bacterium]